MLGSIVNAVAIIAGTMLGLFIRQGIKDSVKATVMQGISLTIILIGMQMALKTQNILLVISSMVIGGIIGELFNIEGRLANLGKWLEVKLGSNEGEFARAFVTTSLIYCVGAMAIMGALESGILGKHDILFAKSMLDGISAVVFASTMGIGVAFSAVPVLIYQGSITLVAEQVKVFLTTPVVDEMTAVGGLLIIAIGFNVLEIKNFRVGNLLPAIFIAVIFAVLLERYGFLVS